MIIKTNGFKMPNGDIHTFIPPSPTENERGGIKAKAKTTEALEVAFDEASERLYAAIPNTDKTLSETGVAADAKTTGDKIKDKLDRNQGIEHYGKSLIVGEDGLVVPGEVQSGGDGIAIINTMSGESPLVIPDSAERVNKRLELGGKTEQVQTTGAQLLPFPYVTGDMTKNGVTFAVQEDGGIKVTGTATEFVIFNIAKIDFGANSIFNNSAGNGKVLSGGKDNVKIEYHGLNKNTYLSIEKGLTVNTVIYPQLQNGTAATPYEPYTGGKPSPSPEYLQEIKNSGKWNEEKQKYEVDVKITGKNLFDMNKFIDTCNFTKNEDGTFIIDKRVERYDCFIPANTILSIEVLKVEDSSGAAALELFYEDGKSMYIGFGQVGVKTFLIQKDVVYIKVLAYRKHEYKYIQLEKGNTATPYEPYKEQTLTLTSDRPITKWDRLVEHGGQIGWLYQSKIVSLTGGEEWETSLNAFYTTTYNFIKNYEAKCSHYVLAGITNQEKNNIFSIGEGVYTNSLWIRDTSFSAVQDFKAHLSDLNEKGDPIMVVSPAAQTEFIPLPQSEQNAIRALKTYYPTTVITNDQGCTMELDYVADTKNYIDNKFAQLQKSLINTNTQLL